MPKLIFGCGYFGKRVAARWLEQSHEVVVVTRSVERAEEFKLQGFSAVVADVTRPDILTKLPTADTVLFAVGYDRIGGLAIMDVYAGGMRNVLDALPAATGRIIYISTTGVYGPAGGEWIDEKTPTDPQRDGGRASLAAELELLASPLAARSIILRLAGIYGPERVPFLKELRAGEPIQVSSTGYLNLIHVDDAATIVLAADELNRTTSTSPNGTPQIFCISDGHPVTRHEFYSEAAQIIGAPTPQFVAPDPDSPRAARARGDRRVRNEKMLAELQAKLTYPNYRAGLSAILETGTQ